MLLWSTLSLARAASLGEDDIREIVTALRPEVAAAAGRSFDTFPRTVISDRAGAARVAGQTLVAVEATDLAHLVAFYLQADDTLYLLTDALRERFAETHTPPELLRPVTRCLLAHELAHALTARQVRFAADADPAAIRLWKEGFASLIQQDLCGADALPQHVVEVWQGVDHATARGLGSAQVQLYVGAREWLRGLRDEGGPDALYRTAHDLPPLEQILAAMPASGVAPGEHARRGATLGLLCTGEPSTPASATAHFVSLTELVGGQGLEGWHASQQLAGGWGASYARLDLSFAHREVLDPRRLPQDRTQLSVYTFDDPGLAAALVTRQAQLAPPQTTRTRATARLARLSGIEVAWVDTTPGTSARRDAPARRHWLAMDGELFVVITDDPQVSTGRVRRAARWWLRTRPAPR